MEINKCPGYEVDSYDKKKNVVKMVPKKKVIYLKNEELFQKFKNFLS